MSNTQNINFVSNINTQNRFVDNDLIKKFSGYILASNKFDHSLYSKYNVKRGLRNADGSGVLVGLTSIGDVHGYIIDEGETKPVEGRLRYRGVDISDLTQGFLSDHRYGYEETVFLLLFGKLPTKKELDEFCDLLVEMRELPDGFKENIIFHTPSKNVMNQMMTSVSQCYAYDDRAEDNSPENVLRQCLELVARFPALVAYTYHAKLHYFDNQSLTIHYQSKSHSTAENFLSLLRPNQEFTELEARVLDLALVIHAEHGGGNNSTFTVHVVSSTDTDTYSAIGAAIASLKGPKHGGANFATMRMMQDIKEHVSDVNNEKQLKEYLRKIIRKEAFDRTGLIYGMGHAVYSYSDPRAVLLKQEACKLAAEKGREDEFALYMNVESLAKEVFLEEKNMSVICANVDFYSGFVYNMLNIPNELHTPLFAISRIAGWSAHRLEEITNGGKIIRPAYKYVSGAKKYVRLDKR